jgi:hypothetical protein
MSSLAICSLVRDGLEYLPAYRRQLESLILAEGDTWNLYILEGDSSDGSWGYLENWAAEDTRIHIVQKHIGQTKEKEALARNWAAVCNACFDLIPADSVHTHVLWLEADLSFPSEVPARLLAHKVDIVSPVIFLGGQFYDTWGFRAIDGRRWENEAPYHPDYVAGRLLPMASVGSCVLFNRAILDAGIRMRGTYESGLLVGMCDDSREKGFRVWADTSTAILHPVTQWQRQMWCPRKVVVETSGGQLELDALEFADMGISLMLPLLDPAKLVQAHFGFFRSQFRALKTNRLDVEVRASSLPERSYELIVSKAPNHWIGGALPFLRNLLCLSLKASQLAAASASGSGANSAFRCNVRIQIDGQATAANPNQTEAK